VTAKRAFDMLVAATGVVVGLPVMVIVALAIKLDTPGPVLFRQERVGQGGKLFRIHKFRTMVADAAASGVDLTIGDDRRITRTGRLLRPSRLDELPQLFDVLAGHMSLVGPRPELPRYVAKYPAALRDKILAVRPGMTDPASLEFADESLLLGRADDPEREYVDVILPRKLAAAATYADRATLLTDLKVIAQSLRLVCSRLGRRS
jgi:lipopolysaccharide/colanic/teichoic acid biosynthesis glycosyltransferase